MMDEFKVAAHSFNHLLSPASAMLSSSGPSISRPRPPARPRKSLNTTNNDNKVSETPSPPPPPYQIAPEILNGAVPLHKRNLSLCSVSGNVDASVAATAQMLGLELDAVNPDNEIDRAQTEQYLRDKSKEELEKLLIKAEAVIRARENELGVAAAVGKQLLETNLSLRQRHASILARTSPMAPIGDAGPPHTLTEDLTTPPRSPIISPTLLHPARTPNQIHTRRLSTSPSQLAILSSQNEDLIQALAKLQDDTSAANLEGKQKLRKLEKEIAGLRTELEHSHQMNDELKERIDKVQTEHEQKKDAQKQEREAKILERRLAATHVNESPSFPNFAPTSNTPTPKKATSGARVSDERPNLVSFPSSDGEEITPPVASGPSKELVILEKLLAKIEELENANREIIKRHQETDSRLRAVTTQSDALQRVYENLEEEIDADDEDGTFSADQSPVRADGLLHPGVLKPNQSLRDRGSPVSSTRELEPLPTLNGKRRKALTPSLYDGSPGHENDDSDEERRIEPLQIPRISALKPKDSKRKLRPRASMDPRLLSSPSKPSPGAKRIRPSASHQSMRSSQRVQADIPPIPSVGGVSLDNDDASKDEVEGAADEGEPLSVALNEALVENRAVTAIRHALDPSNHGKPLEEGEHILPVGSLEGSPDESFFLLSHAVASRPTKWTQGSHDQSIEGSKAKWTQGLQDGTMGAPVPKTGYLSLPAPGGASSGVNPWKDEYPEGSETERERERERSVRYRSLRGQIDMTETDSEAEPSRRMAALLRMNEAAEARTRRPPRSRGRRSEASQSQAAMSNAEDRPVVERRKRRQDELPKDGWAGTLVEIWIILQAAIILLVFVYSMARRGPRAILDAAEVNKRRPS